MPNDRTAATVQQWLTEAKSTGKITAFLQHGILMLEQLLAVLTPEDTAHLANYANAFNPETSITYIIPASRSARGFSAANPGGRLYHALKPRRRWAGNDDCKQPKLFQFRKERYARGNLSVCISNATISI
jgi:hypothetical protein